MAIFDKTELRSRIEGIHKDQPKEQKTILVVDDQKSLCDALSSLLKDKYFLVITAGDGLEAFALFKKNRPDLVITDIRMPFVDGIELIGLIKNEEPSTPIIVITGYEDPKIFMKAYQMGVDKFILRPFALEYFLKNVKDVLNKSKLQQDLHRFKDISDLLLKENKILKERIETLSKSRESDLSGKEAEKYKAVCSEVAHDLKGEFMHIGYSLKEIRESADQSLEITEECDMIERSLAYSRLLLQRLLNFLDIGTLQMEPIELAEVIRKTETLAAPRLPSNIQLQIQIFPNAAKSKISANSEQLMAILMEFINNASKVMRPNGGTIEITLEENDNHALVSIKDDGPGIPAELRKKILKEQVPSKNGSLGLGLYLCNKVIHQIGGKLNMETKKGKGTTFTMILPTTREQKEA